MNQTRQQAQKINDIKGRFDPVLLGACIALASLGVIMVASASVAIAASLNVGMFHFITRHLVFLAAGIVGAAVISRIELRRMEALGRYFLLACFVLLALVFVPGLGHSVNGAKRWIKLGISNFQAVEAVKLFLLIWLASYLARQRDAIRTDFAAVLKPLGVAGVIVLALLAQPDFGSSVLICAVVAGVLFISGARLHYLFAPALLAVPAFVFLAFSESYRVRRLTSFLNPWDDPFSDGYQLTQALIAIGRGEIFGVGLGSSVQKLLYLPEAHTDFIFAVTAEELGLFGVFGMITCFALLGWRAMLTGLKGMEVNRRFSALLAFGIGLWMSLQAIVSMGVNLGMLPTKGLTLPLISSGGSSLIMTCLALGVLLRATYEVDRAARQIEYRRTHGPGSGSVSVDDVDDEDLYQPEGSPLMASGPRTAGGVA